MKQDFDSSKINSRRKKILIGIVAALAVGAAYFVFNRLTGIYIPCVFRLVTELKCPGCGASHMCRFVIESVTDLSLFKAAAAENYFLFFTSPFIIFEIIYSIYCSWKNKPQAKANKIILYIYLGALIVWGIVRNIVGL